ncbi:MAG: hypothetical protein ABH871_04285 [Pseudomonadota bacterium]
MRNVKVFVVISSVMFFVACGGSSDGGGGGGTAAQQAEAAADVFFGVLQACGLNNVGAELEAGVTTEAELAKQLAQCACPGGGTMDINIAAETVTVTADNCKSQDNQNFTGTVTVDNAAQTADINMTDFGDDCSSVTADDINFNEGNCAGTINITCTAGTTTCNLNEPTTAGEGCEADCS